MTKFWPMAWKCKCRIDLQRIQGVLQRSSKNPRGPAGMDPLSFVILLPTLLFGMHIMTGSLATFFRSLGSGPRDGRVWPGRSLCLEDFLFFFFPFSGRSLRHTGSSLQRTGFSSCGVWVQLPCCMWDLRSPTREPASTVLEGRFLTTEPSGKPLWGFPEAELQHQPCLIFLQTNVSEM